ncbi:MAG: methyltransferase [Candidatus Magnetomorum sp.]|nr:methyltransferase [Candidatus Magnetomorum sp.]
MKISWNPGELLKVSGHYWIGCTLHAGVKLDIFSMIDEHVKTALDINTMINGDIDATTRLLDALVAMGLLKKQKGSYANTSESLMFLHKASPKYVGYMIQHHHHLVESWSKLDQAVKTGKPVRTNASFADETVRESFLMGMFNNALNLAPYIAEQVDLTNKHHLLDLGGGPGTYAIHFCMKNPELKATIYDLPTTLPFASKIIDRFQMAEKVSFVGGNYLQDQPTGDFDVVWLSHILHGEGPKDCEQLIQKAVSVLKPGGLILIHEFILNDTLDAPLFPALFSLNMLIGTQSGRAYSEKQLFDMLMKAGLKNIRHIPLETPNDSGIVTGELL